MTYGISGEVAGDILDTFKEKHEAILFRTQPVSEGIIENVFEKEYKMHGIQSLISKVESIQWNYGEKKDALSERRSTLEETIAIFDKKIAETNDSISGTLLSIQEKREQIQGYNVQSIGIKKEINKNKQVILKYLAYIYTKWGTIYDENNSVDTLKLLILNDGNIDDILSDIFYKGMITEVGQNYIEEYRALNRKLQILKLNTDDQIGELIDLQKKLEYNNAMLASQKQEREKLLEVTKGQEALFTTYIESQERAKQSLQLSWLHAQDDYNDAISDAKKAENCSDAISWSSEKCEKIELYFQREKEIRSESLTGTNLLEWPVENPRITTYFRDPEYYALFHSHHDAIDIATPQGSDVHAAQDGYVSYILPPTPWGYSYIVIRHPDNLITVYGHLSEIWVELFQYVRVGDSIWKSGGSPGTPWAGPMTTGAHLHFEVWKNDDQEAVDPLRYLTLKDLNPENLATRYLQKFISDVVADTDSSDTRRQIQDTFTIKGNTEIERQKYLLSTYAAPSFRDWRLWFDEALAGGIDPSFLMCIGLSESSLGYHLKTAYNVWNIGNTDNGSTYTFASPKEGIYWMARTFNNKFLGKYTQINELSRWGNSDGPIYASSNENWHNNTIRCLSSLKGRFIEDNFVFRLGKPHSDTDESASGSSLH